MIARLESLFLDHPRSVNESYLQHTCFALWFSGQLALAALAAFCHALLPFTCQKTASTIIARLYERTHNRGN